MSAAVGFLHALSHCLSAIGLYAEGHPAREKALEDAYTNLLDLQEDSATVVFTFLADEVVYGETPLRGLRNWALAARLAENGIERLELGTGVTREEVGVFVIELADLIAGRKEYADIQPGEFDNIRFGPVSLLDGTGGYTLFNLYEQAEMADGLFTEASANGAIHAALSAGVLDSIWGVMHAEEELVIPQVPITEGSELAVVRALNTSVLAVALGEFMQLAEPEIMLIAEAALLHDIGKVTVPEEILNKPGELTDEEWSVIRRHPLEGARILMRSGERFGAAAVAASEHHLDLDGSGYPEFIYPRTPHRISQVVRLCDVYDAMRTRRPYEPELGLERIMEVLTAGTGSKFAPDLVKGFTRMLSTWRDRFVAADAGLLG